MTPRPSLSAALLLAALAAGPARAAQGAAPPGSPAAAPERLSCAQAWEVVDLALERHVLHDRLTPALTGQARDLLVEQLVEGAPWLLAADVAALRAAADAASPAALLEEAHGHRCDHVTAQLAVVARALDRAAARLGTPAQLAARLPRRPPAAAPAEPPLPLADEAALDRFAEAIALDQAFRARKDAPWAECLAFGARRTLAALGRGRAALLDVGAAQVNAYAAALDPHTRYLDAEAYERWDVEAHPPTGMLGLTLGIPVPGGVRVDELLPGSPLAATGRLRPGDVLVAVGAAALADLDTEDASVLIAAAEDPVRLRLARRAGGKLGRPFEVSVSRRPLPGRSVDVETSLRKALGRRVLVTRIDSLDEGVARDVERSLRSRGALPDAMVLDLRGCGGGFIDEATAIAGLFLDGGTLVRVRARDGKTRDYDDPTAGHAYGGPLVVLVDEETASGCEIIAGALQARGRALVAGTPTTFGKGSAQSILDEEVPSGALLVTTELWFLPDGRSPQVDGVRADLLLAPHDPEAKRERDLPRVLPAPAPLPPWAGTGDADPAVRLVLPAPAPAPRPAPAPAKGPRARPADEPLARASELAARLSAAREQVAKGR